VDHEALGEVLGELLGIDTMGDDSMGMDTVGRRRRHHKHRRIPIMNKPDWRQGQLAPGVLAPSEGLEPMPLTPNLNGGVFDASTPLISFTGRPQRPFRGERLLAQVLRSGTSAAGVFAVTTGVFVGTSLQQLQIGNYNLDFFPANAFGVRLDMIPAEPGIDITINVTVTPAATITGTDFLSVQLLLLGRCMR
jgi:hypothetical protein